MKLFWSAEAAEVKAGVDPTFVKAMDAKIETLIFRAREMPEDAQLKWTEREGGATTWHYRVPSEFDGTKSYDVRISTAEDRALPYGVDVECTCPYYASRDCIATDDAGQLAVCKHIIKAMLKGPPPSD